MRMGASDVPATMRIVRVALGWASRSWPRDPPYQITDAQPSYGRYSGAPADEKITWGKLEGADIPCFNIKLDATIVAPLMFAYILWD